jgi:hypothetical protein
MFSITLYLQRRMLEELNMTLTGCGRRRSGNCRERPSSCVDGIKDGFKTSVMIVDLWDDTRSVGLADILQLYYGVVSFLVCCVEG